MSTTTGAWLGSTFRELTSLRRGAHALAAALPRLGAADPSTVVLLARNSFLPLDVTMAVAVMGARVVPVSPHATAKELDFLLRDSGARIAIGDADLLGPMRDVLNGVVTIAHRTPDDVAGAYGIAADSRVVPPWCRDYDEVTARRDGDGDIATAPASRPDASMNSLFYTRYSLVLVRRDDPGVALTNRHDVLGYSDAYRGGHPDIVFTDACGEPLGEAGGGLAAAQRVLGPARMLHSMRLVGTAERALELMTGRLRSREVRGRSLAGNDLWVDRVGGARIAVESMRALVRAMASQPGLATAESIAKAAAQPAAGRRQHGG